jgi:hypothetical protein
MKLIYSLGVHFLAALSACAGFRVGTEFSSGRQALIEGKYETALGHFQVAAQKDPDYVYGGLLRQGAGAMWVEPSTSSGNIRRRKRR